jgi:hypothetical protein
MISRKDCTPNSINIDGVIHLKNDELNQVRTAMIYIHTSRKLLNLGKESPSSSLHFYSRKDIK